MTQKVPEPFESTNDARGFFDELVGQSPTRTSSQNAGFSLSGFSSDDVLDIFKDETNAMMKGEISKIKELSSQVMELRLSAWKGLLDGAIDKIDEKIQVIANIESPQKGEERRKEEDVRRPIAFALLKAIKAGLVQQTDALAAIERDLIANKLQTEHANRLTDLLEFLQLPKDPREVSTKLEQFLRSLFSAFKMIFGTKGFQGLALYLQNIQKQLPKQFQELFLQKFVAVFQQEEDARVVLPGDKKVPLELLLQLHEALGANFAPNEPGVSATMTDDAGLVLHYFKGLADMATSTSMNENVPIPQGRLSGPFIAKLAEDLAQKGLLNLDEEISRYFPELQSSLTVGDLVSMKTGLPDVDMLATLLGKDPALLTPDEKLMLLQKYSKASTPTGVLSSTDCLLLAKLIEKIIKMPLNEYAKQELFDKLKLVKTEFSKLFELVTTPKELAHLLQQITKDTTLQTAHSAGFALAFVTTDKQFSLHVATTREKLPLETIVKELIAPYGLAFVPFPFITFDEGALKEVATREMLQKQLKRFEGRYRSEELSTTWQLAVEKNHVEALGKEYWGLQVAGLSALFFIPTEISDDTARFILSNKPICSLEFSKNQFVLQDPDSSIKNLLFKKC